MVRNLVKNTDDVRHPYITHLNADSHAGLPPAILVTNGFDPLRDVGHAYAQKLAAADNDLTYMHNPGLTHGFPQFTRSSAACHQATLDLADLSKPRSDSRSADPPRAPLKPVRQVMADQTVSGPTEPLQLAPTKAISVQ